MSIRSALAGGGAALAIVAAVLGFTAGDVTNPGVTDPVIEVLSLDDNPCHAGWAFKPAEDQELRVEGCDKDGWRVILKADRSFSHAITPSGAFEFDPARVPEW